MQILSKSKIKFVRSLQQRKYRQKYHNIVVEGVKVVNELLHEFPERVITVCAQKAYHDEILNSVPPSCAIYIATEHEMNQLSAFKTPPPVLAVVEPFPARAITQDAHSDLCLFIDAIADPGNLGTIFRIADWFGIKSIFLSDNTVEPYNPKVIQASMMSVFRVKWAYASIQDFDGLPILAAAMTGTPLKDCDEMSKGLLVLGNEAHGVSEIIQSHCTSQVTISGKNRLGAESLNVAVAAGILCAYLHPSDRQ